MFAAMKDSGRGQGLTKMVAFEKDKQAYGKSVDVKRGGRSQEWWESVENEGQKV